MKFVTTIKTTLVSSLWLMIFSALVLLPNLKAEGIRQVAPTAGDAPVMLETGRPEFGSFADFNGPASGRLVITIGNLNETVFLGLSTEYNDDGKPFPGTFAGQYRFRIRRASDGAVVHGPFIVNGSNANATTWEQAQFGVYNVNITQNSQLMYRFQPTQLGNYYLEFDEASFPDGDDKVNIPFWDITVARNNVPINGRVWSRNWAFRTPPVDGLTPPDCVWVREFNGSLYSYTTDGFVSKIDFQNAGLQGLSFNIAFNSKGPGSSGNLTEDRKSVPNANATLNSAEHQIFLSEPDPVLFPSGICGQLITPASFSCLNENSYCLEVAVTKPGQVEVVLDFNRNGLLDPDSEDVNLVFDFPANQLSGCIPWNGLRGDGTPVTVGDTIDLIFFYSQGIQHWSAYDVEFLRNGYCIETIRPLCEPNISSSLLFWDDRNIVEDPATGAPRDGRNGCNCATGCRTWSSFNLNAADCSNFDDNATTGYGDKTTINTWWFANTSTIVRVNIPLVQAMIVGPDSICLGETATLVASDAGATGTVTYQWTGPNNFTANTAQVNVSTAGEYCVQITDQLGCSNTICKLLTVVDAGNGTISYPPSLSACIGSSVTLVATGDINSFTYSWSPATGLSATDVASPSFTFASPITYTVTITNTTSGCSFTQAIAVAGNVEPIPGFTTQSGCNQGLGISFVNTSTAATQYSWDFGDPTTTADISTQPNPNYTYPGPGTYQVKLVVTSVDGCVAMLLQDVVITNIPLIADFDISYDTCPPDAVVVRFTDTSVNGAGNTTAWSWTFGGGNGSSNLPNPTLTLTTGQTITVNLTITTADGCTESTSQTVTIQLGPPTDQFPDVLLVCPGTAVQISPGGNPAYTYSWSPTAGIDNPTSPQPTFSPAATTTYTVTVTSSGADVCTVVETVLVTVPSVINLQVTGGGNFCTPSTTLTATTSAPTTIEWQDSNGNLLATGPNYTPPVSGTTEYTVTATDASNCSETTTVTVTGGPVNFSVPDTVAVCFGQEILLNVTNLDENDILTYSWLPASSFVAGTNTLAMPNYIETIGAQDVTVELSNQFGCTASALINVAVVNPNIDLSFTSQIDCNGGTVSFTNTSTNAFGYVWDFGDGTPRSYAANPVYAYADGGIYTVTLDIVYDVDCVVPFSQQVMVMEPQIFAGFTYDIAECSAEAAVVQFMDTSTNTLNNTTGWQWTFSNATPATSTLQNPTVTVPNSGPLTVSLTIETANGCSNTITETLAIQVVDLDISLTDTIVVCRGDAVTLNPNGDPELTYSWMPTTGLDNPTAASPVATPLVTTTYVVAAYSTVGADTCFVTDSVVLFVPADINLVLNQDSVVVTCGEDVVITASADANISVTWCNLQGEVLATGSSITVNPFRTDTIVAKAVNEFGCLAQDTVIVIDNGVDAFIDPGSLGGSITACQGVDTTLTVVNQDDQDILSYEWSPAANIIGPTDGASVQIMVNEVGTVVFTVIVANDKDCRDTLSVMVNVQEFAGQVADTALVCYNEATPINPGGNTTYTYNWSPTTGLDLSNPANPVVTLTENQTYQVTITDPATGCNNQDSIVVIVQPDLDLQTTGGTQLCEVVAVTLSATTAVATNITWFFNDTSIGTGPTISVIPPGDGCHTYTAVATDPLTGCVPTSEEVICVQEFMGVLPDGPVTVCVNEPTPINPSGNPELVYTWTPEDEAIDLTQPWNPVVTTSVPRTYFVTLVDPVFGCTVTDTINILVAPQLNLAVTPTSNVLCDNTELTLTATTDFAPASLSWFLLPGDEPLGTGATLTFTPPLGSSQVYAVATSADGCTERDTATVSNFPINASITEELVICEPTATVELSVTNNDPDQDLTILWASAGVLSPLNQATVTVDPNAASSFSATVTNQFGCSEVLTTSVTVIDLLGDLSISIDQDTILLDESATITVSGCLGCNYEWDPAAPDSPVITVTPGETGESTYFVTVSLLGCTQNLEVSLVVIDGTCDVDHVFLPNAFTPNGDGDNDFLQVRSSFVEQLTEFELLIYNRWGEEIFRTQNPLDRWDGTFRDERLPPDVYGYYLRVVCPNGDELVQKGNITLLR